MSPRLALTTAALSMGAAVALGAFGAHALKTRVAPEMIAVWQTAVNYHAWHALALLATGILMTVLAERSRPMLGYVAALFFIGVLLFSGSLYALALGAPSIVGVVTPFGGLAFIVGWLLLAVAVARGT